MKLTVQDLLGDYRVASPEEVLAAAGKIIAHNHPSGSSEPSQADKNLTYRLREALALVEVRLLDHIIVGEDCTSLSENGLM